MNVSTPESEVVGREFGVSGSRVSECEYGCSVRTVVVVMGSGSGGWSTVGRGACEEPARKPQAEASHFSAREGLCSRARSFLDWPERERELIGR